VIASSDRASAPALTVPVIITALAAVISAYATLSVVHFTTPIDDALPLVAVILCVVAAVSSPTVMVAVPLLMAGEIALADERTRLLWFGAVVALSFAAALIRTPPRIFRGLVLTIAAIVLLRWIPLRDVTAGRELVLLFIALAIAAALRFTAIAVAIAVASALFTPLVPLRTLAIPLALLFVTIVAAAIRLWRKSSASDFDDGSERMLDRMAPVLPIAAAFAVAVMLMFFAWSGAFARALPVVWRGLPQPGPLQPIGLALSPGQHAFVDVPPNARALIVSGANVSRLRRGTVVGRVDPGGRLLKIGDVVDWGSLRREQYFAARNRVPGDPAGRLRDYGYEAWIDGASRVPLPKAAVIRVTADRALPSDARLQVQYFELERQ
jgi:hypothetical protein